MDSHNFSSEKNSVFVVKEISTDDDDDDVKHNFDVSDDNLVIQLDSNDELKQVESEVVINSSHKSVNNVSELTDHDYRNVEKNLGLTGNSNSISSENNCVPEENILNHQEENIDLAGNSNSSENNCVPKENILDDQEENADLVENSYRISSENNCVLEENILDDQEENADLAGNSGTISSENNCILEENTNTLDDQEENVDLAGNSDSISSENNCVPEENILDDQEEKLVTVTVCNDLICLNKEESLNISTSNSCDNIISNDVNERLTEINHDGKEKMFFSEIIKENHNDESNSESSQVTCNINSEASHTISKPISIISVKSLKITKNEPNINKDMQNDAVLRNTDEAQSSKCCKNKRSKVWKYFTILNLNETQCNLCLKKFHSCSSSSNLLRHLRSQHANKIRFDDEKENVFQIEESIDISPDKVKNESPTFVLPNRKKTKKISRIWKYFTKSKLGVVKCNVCFGKIPYRNSNSFLFRHLRFKHLRIYNLNKCSLSKSIKLFNNFNKAIELSKTDHKNGSEPTESSLQHFMAASSDVISNQNVDKQKVIYTIRRTSETWNYFTKLNSNKTKCNVCDSVLKYKDGVSSNLTRHLRLRHKNIHSKFHSVCKSPLLQSNDTVAKSNLNKKFVINVIQPKDVQSKYNYNDDKNVTKIRKYFTKSSSGIVVCNLCHTSLSHSRGSTFNLKFHIIIKHKDIFEKIVEAIYNEENEVSKSDSEREKKCEKIKLNWQYFMKMKSGKLKCNLCPELHPFYCDVSDSLAHLHLKHDIDCNEEEFLIPASEFVDVNLLCYDENTSTDGDNLTINSVHNVESNLLCFDENTSANGDNLTINSVHNIESTSKKSNEIVKTDRTWKYFTKIYHDKHIEVKCNLCDDIFSYTHGVTSNLTQHLNLVHINNQFKSNNESIKLVQASELRVSPVKTEKEIIQVEETEIKKSVINKSTLTWKYYTLAGQRKAKCNICQSILSFSNRSNSNLSRHLKRVHKVEINLTSDAVSTNDDKSHPIIVELQSITGEVHGDKTFNTNSIYDYKNDEKLKNFIKCEPDCIECKICSKTFLCNDINNYTNILQQHMQINHAEWQVVCLDGVSYLDADPELSNYNELEAIANEVKSFKITNNQSQTLNEDESTETTMVDLNDSQNETYKNVWKYFTKLTSVNVRCNFCSLLLSYRNSKKWNLYRHLRLKHSSKLDDDEDFSIERKGCITGKNKIHNKNSPRKKTPDSKVKQSPVKKEVQSNVSHLYLPKKYDSSDTDENDKYNTETPVFINRIGRTWSNFTKVDMGKATCNICHRSIHYRGTGSDILNEHLQKFHIESSYAFKVSVCDEDYGKYGKKSTSENNVSCNDDNSDDDDGCSSSKLSIKEEQETSLIVRENEVFSEEVEETNLNETDNKLTSEEVKEVVSNIKENRLSSEVVKETSLLKKDTESERCEGISDDDCLFRNRSSVWTYFTKAGNGFAKCHLCLSQITCKGGTVNLIRHLQRIHSVVSLPNPTRECTITCSEDKKEKSQLLAAIDLAPNNLTESKKRVCFTKIGNNIAKCNFCSKVLSHKDGSIFKLTNHLQRMHCSEIMNYNNLLFEDNIKTSGSGANLSTSTNDVESAVQNPSSSVIKSGDQNDMPNKKRSDTWLYYTKLNNDYAQCNICSNALSYKGGSVYNLTRHLFIKHDIKLLKRTAVYKQKTNCRDVKTMPKIFNIRKKKSGTLSFYTKINRYLVKCKLCSKRFIYKGLNINRLANHLWSSHITRLIEFNNGCTRSNADHIIESNDEKQTMNLPLSEMEDYNMKSTAQSVFKSMSGNIRKPDQGRQISNTWKYFTKNSDDDTSKARCNICFKYFSYKNGNISNLSRHLLRNHGIKLVKSNPKDKNSEINNSTTSPKLVENTSLTEIYIKNSKKGKGGKYSFGVPFTDLCNEEFNKSNMASTKNDNDISKYFKKINESEVECNVCNKKIILEEGRLNRLRNHLFLIHKIKILSYVQSLSLITSKNDESVVAEPFGKINNEILINNSVKKKKKKSRGCVFRMKCKLCYRCLIFNGNKTDKLVKHLNGHEKELSINENLLLQKFTSENNDDIGDIDVKQSDNKSSNTNFSKIVLYKYFKNLNLFKNKCKICNRFISSNIHCYHRITNDLSITYGIKRNKSFQGNVAVDIGDSAKALKQKRVKLSSNIKNVNHFMNVNLFENECGSCNVSLKNEGYCSHSLNQWLTESQEKESRRLSEFNDQVKIEDELEIISDALNDGENKIIIITDDGASPILNYENANKNGNASDEVSYHVIGVDGENNDDIQVIIYNFNPEESCISSDQQMNDVKVKDESADLEPCNKELEEQVKVILQELNSANSYSNQIENKCKGSVKNDEKPTNNWQTPISFQNEKVVSAKMPLEHQQEELSCKNIHPDKAVSELQSEAFTSEESSVLSPINPKQECKNSLGFIQSQRNINSGEASIQKNVVAMMNKSSNSIDVSSKHLRELSSKPQETTIECNILTKTVNKLDNNLAKGSITIHKIKSIESKDANDEGVCNSSTANNIDRNNEGVFEEAIVNLIETMEEFNSIDPVIYKNESFDIGSGMYLQNVNGLHKVNKNLIYFSNINYQHKTAKCNICSRYLLFKRPVIYNLMTHLYLKHKHQIIMDNAPVDITCDKNGRKILDLLNCNDDNNSNDVKPRRKSPVWKYFINSTDFRATCKICRFNFSYKGGAVNNLGRHLRLRHNIHVSSKNASDNNSHNDFEFYTEDDINRIEGCLIFPKKRAAIKLRSKTWNYFSKEPNDWAKCILCKKYLSYRSSTINNLTRHLRTVHSNIYNSLFLEKDNATSTDDAIEHSELSDDIYKSILLETTGSRSRDEVLQECSHSERSGGTKRKSVVWNYFTEVCRDSGRCNFCLKVISCKGGGTSNLSRHLRVKHGIWIVLTSTLTEQYEEQFLKAGDNNGTVPAPNQSESASEKQNDTIITHEQLHILKNKKPSYRKSKTWDFFVKETPERVVCKICAKTLSYKCKAVHNLRRHLAIKHPNYIVKRENVRLKLQVSNENESINIDGENESLDAKSYIDITDTSVVIVDEENPPPVRRQERSSRPKKSFVWNYFNELEYGIAKCNMCMKVLSFRGGGTNNLMRHLRSRHSIVIDLQFSNNANLVTTAETVSESLTNDNDVHNQDHIDNVLPVLATDN